jgi:hypothetical protein
MGGRTVTKVIRLAVAAILMVGGTGALAALPASASSGFCGPGPGTVALGPDSSFFSQMVFHATSADACFTGDSNGIETDIVIFTTSSVGLGSTGGQTASQTFIQYVQFDDSTGFQISGAFAFDQAGANFSPGLSGASYGPTTLQLFPQTFSSPFGPAVVTANWTAVGPAQHDTMITFFVKGHGGVAVDHHVSTVQPATATLSVVLPDGTDLASGLTLVGGELDVINDETVFKG